MKKALLTLALCAAASGPALAQHWYGAVDIGTLNMRNTIYADPGSVTVSGGYRFSPNLGAEAGVTAIGDTTFVNNNGSRTARQGDMRFLAVGFLPINPNFEFFGKAGLGLHTARVRGSGTYDGTTGPHTTTNVIVGAGMGGFQRTQALIEIDRVDLGQQLPGLDAIADIDMDRLQAPGGGGADEITTAGFDGADAEQFGAQRALFGMGDGHPGWRQRAGAGHDQPESTEQNGSQKAQTEAAAGRLCEFHASSLMASR